MGSTGNFLNLSRDRARNYFRTQPYPGTGDQSLVLLVKPVYLPTRALLVQQTTGKTGLGLGLGLGWGWI